VIENLVTIYLFGTWIENFKEYTLKIPCRQIV